MRILGTGGALPSKTVTNRDFEGFLDTSDEWIESHTGIRSRQIITDETLLSLGTLAGRRALDDAGIGAGEIDYLICATLRGDTITPGLGCMLTGALGVDAPALDVNGACAGFVYALDMADAYIASGKAKRILIVCAEANSRLPDYLDRATCVLFGDGAGAVVVGPGEGFIAARLTVAANDKVLIMHPHPGNSPFASKLTPASPLLMAGQEVYKFAVNAIVRDLRWLCEQTEVCMEDVDLFVLHQANLRILEAARARLGIPQERFPHNVEVRGNTSSASIPILLDELSRAGRLKPGMTLAMSAFGAGLTTGACLIKWTKAGAISENLAGA